MALAAAAPAIGLGAPIAISKSSTCVARASHAAPLRPRRTTTRRGGVGARGGSSSSAGAVVRAAAQPWDSSSAAASSSDSGSTDDGDGTAGWALNGSWVQRAGTAAVAAALAVTLSAGPALAETTTAETGRRVIVNKH